MKVLRLNCILTHRMDRQEIKKITVPAVRCPLSYGSIKAQVRGELVE